MNRIKLVDCTLRDGGYVNDWNFGHDVIKDIIGKLVKSKIEVIEIGFLGTKPYNADCTLFSSFTQMSEIIAPKSSEVVYAAMIDMGDAIPLECIPDYDNTSVDALRVIFKKPHMDKAYDYCDALIKKGYKVFVQLVSSDTYTDTEFVEAIRKFNNINPYAFSIVDTFGLMKRKDFLRMVYLADNNLNKEICIGYHSHNNLQQASGNAEAMVEANIQRTLYIDACVYGMGRGAGNLNLELFANYMNDNLDTHYRIEPILEIIDRHLGEIHSHSFWGYSLPFYLSASTGTHPNYAAYLSEKGTLTAESMNEILKSLSLIEKEVYLPETAEKYYKEYMQNYVDDKPYLTTLTAEFRDQQVLVIAPGSTLDSHKEHILKFIAEKKPIVISLNFISEDFRAEYLFSSNIRRYRKIESVSGIRKIITSNIKEAKQFDYRVNFASFANQNPLIIDNSGLMLINLLISLGVKHISLAGFDGYQSMARNYIDMGLEYGFDNATQRNQSINEQLAEQSKKIKIDFITPTLYGVFNPEK